MIIQCKSCEKKFSVPDGAIGAKMDDLFNAVHVVKNGHSIQINLKIKNLENYEIPQNKNNFNKPKITKQANKKRIKKQGPTMYSSEYLKKKTWFKYFKK